MKKQQVKSLNTRNKIIEAASALFAEHDCNDVSVAEIVKKAECSVGAFYGHFKSKEILVSNIWLGITTDAISESVEKGSRISDRGEFVDYLIERSIETGSHPLMNKLSKSLILDAEGRRELEMYASRYLAMIRNMLHEQSPNASEEVLWSYASIIHNLLNAHSQQSSGKAGYFRFSNEVTRRAILALMDICKDDADQSKI